MTIGIDASQANRIMKTGTERYAHTLLRSLAAIDRTTSYRVYSNTPLVEDLRNLGANFTECVLRWPPRRLWTLLRLSLAMAVHPPTVLYMPAHVLPLVHPRRTATMVHDVGFLRHPELYAKKEVLYHTFALRLALRSATAILVPSVFSKEELIDFAPSAASRIHIVPHGFEREAFRPAASSDVDRVRTNYAIAAPYFLFVGRVQAKKNAPRILEAYARFVQERPSDPTLLVFAGQPGFGFIAMEQYIAEHRLTSRVIITGYVPQHDVVALLTGSRAFIFPSLYEGFGFPVLEAQSVGVPVLTSARASLPEVGGDAAYYVDPTSVEAIANGMRELNENESLRAELQARALKNLERFSWETAARRTRDLLLLTAS